MFNALLRSEWKKHDWYCHILVENTLFQEIVALRRSTLLLKKARDKLFKILLAGVLTCFKWADMSAKLKIGYNCVFKTILKHFQIVLKGSKIYVLQMRWIADLTGTNEVTYGGKENNEVQGTVLNVQDHYWRATSSSVPTNPVFQMLFVTTICWVLTIHVLFFFTFILTFCALLLKASSSRPCPWISLLSVEQMF